MVPLDQLAVSRPDDPLQEAVGRLQAFSLRRGLVLDDGRLAGLLSISDVVRVVDGSRAAKGNGAAEAP
jgi:CBS domain-containing protein